MRSANKDWWAVTVDCPPEHQELAAAFFYDQGAEGVEYEDGKPATPAWADELIPLGRPFLRAYFPDGPRWPEVFSGIRNWAQAAGFALKTTRMSEEDWAHSWKRYYHAVQPGNLIWIVPAWEEPPDAARLVIQLDPGMAFGTGTHPTTAMMIRLLERYVQRDQRWLDVGTGSGILALAAWLLGAKVWAVEPDPVAVASSAANFDHHRADIALTAGTLRDLSRDDRAFDGLMANLTAQLLVDEWDSLKERSRPGAWWLLSGIIKERAPLVQACVDRDGFQVVERLDADDWCAWAVRT